MALAGKAEIAADFPDGFPGITEQDFGLLQLGTDDEGAEIEAQLRFEFMRQVGPAEAGMFRHGFYGQMHIGMLPDILNDLLQFVIFGYGKPGAGHLGGEIQMCFGQQVVYGIRTGELFHILYV